MADFFNIFIKNFKKKKKTKRNENNKGGWSEKSKIED